MVRRTAEAKVRYAAGYCPMLVYDLSRQRLGLFSMPPAATVEADVLKNCGSCHEVNTGLSTKATLALLAAFKVFGVFLSHKDQRLEVLNRFVYQFQPTSLCDCIQPRISSRRPQEESSSWGGHASRHGSEREGGAVPSPSREGYFTDTGRTPPAPSS